LEIVQVRDVSATSCFVFSISNVISCTDVQYTSMSLVDREHCAVGHW